MEIIQGLLPNFCNAVSFICIRPSILPSPNRRLKCINGARDARAKFHVPRETNRALSESLFSPSPLLLPFPFFREAGSAGGRNLLPYEDRESRSKVTGEHP